MKTSTKIQWTGNMSWETELFGHKLTLDAGKENGGDDKGPRPKILMLTALAGCTGMDVVSILKKMRVEVEDIQIIVEGDLTEEHPKYYDKMHVIYEFKGKDLPMDKLEKAVSLSEEKYCGVSALYKKVIPVTTEIRVVE
ncbi:OsmC family protein [Carboxylicivirga marina]|uniref:OsmC family protein n=1 Tax=Carboxylicivirga marina TaxID=2800988 RepID=A0ABS1HF81_9BACT|nr:OsmC family protein [Carboxylicivirga marina]MBK3516299.1 OsmC family protein [Carboxylicivirga marina]